MLLLLAHICPESLLSVRLPAAGHHLQLRVGMGFVYRLLRNGKTSASLLNVLRGGCDGVRDVENLAVITVQALPQVQRQAIFVLVVRLQAVAGAGCKSQFAFFFIDEPMLPLTNSRASFARCKHHRLTVPNVPTQRPEAKMLLRAAMGTLRPARPAGIPLELPWARQVRWDREGLHRVIEKLAGRNLHEVGSRPLYCDHRGAGNKMLIVLAVKDAAMPVFEVLPRVGGVAKGYVQL
mmetsp:Transcript_122589/g.291461  ORF Transcript_122589/g.291461 Transcript_122589/m.291461 type:complete len:236 (-) Transcript_122589:912-1619(-)